MPSPFGLAIGRGNYDRKRGFDGDIDEVGIWTRVLADAEIAGLTARGKAGRSLAPPDRKEGFPAAWPALGKPFGKGASDAGLRLDGKKRPIAMTASPEGLAMFVPSSDGRIEAGAGKAVPLPEGAAEGHELDRLEFLCGPSGDLHVLAQYMRYSEKTTGQVFHARLSPEGELRKPWTEIRGGLRPGSITPDPELLPGDGGSVLAFLHGTTAKGDGALQPFRLEDGGTKPEKALTGPGEALLRRIYAGRVVGPSPKEPWLVSEVGRDLVWTDPKSLKAIPARKGVIRAGAMGMWQAHGARSGEVFVAVTTDPAPDREKEPGTGDETMRLRLLRGRPGRELAEAAVLDASFSALGTPAFAESPGGRVILIAPVCDWGDHHGEKELLELRIDAWSVAGAKPERIGGFARARNASDIHAVFSDETTLHVIFGDVEGYWADTWKVEPPGGAAGSKSSVPAKAKKGGKR